MRGELRLTTTHRFREIGDIGHVGQSDSTTEQYSMSWPGPLRQHYGVLTVLSYPPPRCSGEPLH